MQSLLLNIAKKRLTALAHDIYHEGHSSTLCGKRKGPVGIVFRELFWFTSRNLAYRLLRISEYVRKAQPSLRVEILFLPTSST